MKAVRTILWIQLALGLVGGYVSFAYVHWGAMSIAWAHGFKVEFEKVRQSPEYREPPPIKGYSLARMVESMESDARARADVAFYWLLTCAADVVFAALLLWLLYRIRQKEYAHSGSESSGV